MEEKKKDTTIQTHEIFNKIRPSKILYPILIGLCVVVWMFYDEFDAKAFRDVEFTFMTIFWIFMAFLMIILRDIGYIIRLKILSGNKLSWYQSLKVIILWEFASAVTPSAVGGTSLAVIFVHKEKINIGESTAIVMATAFLDELYFIVLFPIVFLILGNDLFTITSIDNVDSFANNLVWFVLIGYGLKLVFILFIVYGLFVKPRNIKWLLINIFKLPLLRKWRYGAQKTGDDLIMASKELKKKNKSFWAKVVSVTFLSWTSRYLVVNCMFLAFFSVSEHFLIYSRQLVSWIMMLVSPTPGGSGFAEYVFKEYLGEFIPIAGFIAGMALLWRMISYYPYLIVGAFVLPRWIKSKFMNH